MLIAALFHSPWVLRVAQTPAFISHSCSLLARERACWRVRQARVHTVLSILLILLNSLAIFQFTFWFCPSPRRRALGAAAQHTTTALALPPQHLPHPRETAACSFSHSPGCPLNRAAVLFVVSSSRATTTLRLRRRLCLRQLTALWCSFLAGAVPASTSLTSTALASTALAGAALAGAAPARFACRRRLCKPSCTSLAVAVGFWRVHCSSLR